MKKFLFLGWLLAAASLTACDKDNEQNGDGPCPVTDIELPQSSEQTPIVPGSTIEIRGNGFEDDCEIWLFEETRTAASAGVKAEILEVSASIVRFTAPDLSGAQSIELRQNNGAWRIGTLVFPEEEEETPVEILPRRISHIKITYPDDLSFVQQFAYDEQGRIASITETDQQYAYPGTTAQDEVTTFAYESDRIVITEPSGAQSILTLVDNRTTAITGVAHNDHYPDDYAFSYDANGYIATSTWIQNPEKTYSAKSIYTVVNGCSPGGGGFRGVVRRKRLLHKQPRTDKQPQYRPVRHQRLHHYDRSRPDLSGRGRRKPAEKTPVHSRLRGKRCRHLSLYDGGRIHLENRNRRGRRTPHDSGDLLRGLKSRTRYKKGPELSEPFVAEYRRTRTT